MNRLSLMCLLVSLCLAAAAAVAQDEIPTFELAGGYSYVNFHPNLPLITSQNLNGGGGAFVWNPNSLFGLKADFQGYTVGTGWTQQLINHGYNITGAASGNLFTYMFGPQVKKHSGKLQWFGEGLFGAAHSNGYATIVHCIENSGCSGKSGNGNNNGFAMEWGLGLDIPIASHVQLRPVEVDYLYTHFGSNHIAGYSATQNSFKYFAGVNFTLGGPK